MCFLSITYGTLIILPQSKAVTLRARICKRLWSPEIDSEESISPAYVA